VPDQAMDTVLPGKALHYFLPMLPGTSRQVGADADVQGSIATTGKYVNRRPALTHTQDPSDAHTSLPPRRASSQRKLDDRAARRTSAGRPRRGELNESSSALIQTDRNKPTHSSDQKHARRPSATCPRCEEPMSNETTRPQHILDPGFELTLRPMRYPEFYE